MYLLTARKKQKHYYNAKTKEFQKSLTKSCEMTKKMAMTLLALCKSLDKAGFSFEVVTSQSFKDKTHNKRKPICRKKQ